MYDADHARPGQSGRRAILHDMEPTADDFLGAALKGLSSTPKALPHRFLYDAEGSALFDRITRLPEYYPTRTEIGILRDNAADIAERLGSDVQLVELGSGSSVKVRILLDALNKPYAYVPIDISRDHLAQAAQAIQEAYPDLRVEAIAADFAQPFDLPPRGAGKRVGFYPGSSIGNFTPAEAENSAPTSTSRPSATRPATGPMKAGWRSAWWRSRTPRSLWTGGGSPSKRASACTSRTAGNTPCPAFAPWRTAPAGKRRRSGSTPTACSASTWCGSVRERDAQTPRGDAGSKAERSDFSRALSQRLRRSGLRSDAGRARPHRRYRLRGLRRRPKGAHHP